MQSIYSPEWGVKATGQTVSVKAVDALQQSIDEMMMLKCDLIISGCTEISVAILQANLSKKYPIIDPIKVVAEETLKYIYGYTE